MTAKPLTTASDGWTIETYVIHADALREADARFEDERDRRYTEVNIEKEKALKIKETADLAALSLARESQTYKEQQNDALRDKNLSESGVYATNSSLVALAETLKKSQEQAIGEIRDSLKPLADFVSSYQGQTKGTGDARTNLYALIAAAAGLAAIFFGLR